MLRLIPAPLHRLGYRAASALRVRWRRVVKPKLRGCRVIAFDEAGRIAFVRLSYGPANWGLPGGGLGRSEDACDGARREFLEETGRPLVNATVVQVSEESSHGASNQVHVVTGQSTGDLVADGREVLEARWFAVDALPETLSERLRRELPGWITAARAADRRTTPPPAPHPAPTR
jgi:8-oxo-dGTP pyrophosphatase MutT (NUDIX family)